jgi:hypothetical protein
MGKQTENLVGQRFNHLVVLAYIDSHKTMGTRWLCQCDCGNTKVIARQSFIRGKAQTCGCLQIASVKTANGISRHELYDTWKTMIRRCDDSEYVDYKNYGGRGITVCVRWYEFENFVADVGERPEGLTLDRVDNDGNYEPSNCRWATASEQAQNSRRYEKPNTNKLKSGYEKD